MYGGMFDKTRKCHRCGCHKHDEEFKVGIVMRSLSGIYCNDCWSGEFRAAYMDLVYHFKSSVLQENPEIIEIHLITKKIKNYDNKNQYDYGTTKRPTGRLREIEEWFY